ncbi:alpha/beta hydrolase [Sphingomonas sp. G-3-2-10]|uniref:alpha/beta hydrolase n=1 Tax=Sphingomonas sp. G-3-2-10 TaxID=2728838 RepID=UPI001F0FBFD2|nr:alpha/beta hydrolase [Sphingomonas sp. G-3-2-10]
MSDAIAAMGRVLGPDVLAAVQDLYRGEQEQLAAGHPVDAADLPYGEHPRHRLDLYRAKGASGPAPVLLWVHGGGFIRGEKCAPDHPYGANVGRWAARAGMLGAVMNYRLAPECGWPAGGEDVGAAVDWLKANAAAHGGDPDRIVAIGTSAGAVHVATHLRLAAGDTGLAGVGLLSGLYGFTPLDDRDTLYYGAPDMYAARMPREAVVASEVPLFVACAEFDPPRFQAETLGLLAARLDTHGQMPRAYIASGHNHFSMGCHIGTADTRLTDEIASFIGAL